MDLMFAGGATASNTPEGILFRASVYCSPNHNIANSSLAFQDCFSVDGTSLICEKEGTYSVSMWLSARYRNLYLQVNGTTSVTLYGMGSGTGNVTTLEDSVILSVGDKLTLSDNLTTASSGDARWGCGYAAIYK